MPLWKPTIAPTDPKHVRELKRWMCEVVDAVSGRAVRGDGKTTRVSDGAVSVIRTPACEAWYDSTAGVFRVRVRLMANCGADGIFRLFRVVADWQFDVPASSDTIYIYIPDVVTRNGNEPAPRWYASGATSTTDPADYSSDTTTKQDWLYPSVGPYGASLFTLALTSTPSHTLYSYCTTGNGVSGQQDYLANMPSSDVVIPVMLDQQYLHYDESAAYLYCGDQYIAIPASSSALAVYRTTGGALSTTGGAGTFQVATITTDADGRALYVDFDPAFRNSSFAVRNSADTGSTTIYCKNGRISNIS